MRVLWVCNIMLPVIAEALHREASNKEGWLSGLLAQVAAEAGTGTGGTTQTTGGGTAAMKANKAVDSERRSSDRIELGIAFPAPADLELGGSFPVRIGELELCCYGFHEDTVHPDRYQPALEPELLTITEDFQPDVIHCFGTEYPHTLAMCKVYPHKERILIGIQGICAKLAEAYFADMPEDKIRRVTFRDLVKRDTLVSQQEKFVRRGQMEQEAVKLAGNITGRTAWDRQVTTGWNPKAHYYAMNETLRPIFYEGQWNPTTCELHSIFVSQGDYPLKGLHYLLLALPGIRKRYPDAQVYIAGNDLTAYHTFKEKLKISAYGRYLRELIRDGGLEDCVHFTGRLTGEEMKERFLRSNLFLCCSSLENSPNSLGEAMLLGVPCVSTEIGGVPSLFTGGVEGILCLGHYNIDDDKNNNRDSKQKTEEQLKNIVNSIEKSIIEMWDHPEKQLEYSKNARERARKTHDKEKNFSKMKEIYANIVANTQKGNER